MKSKLGLALVCICAPCWAQTTPAAAASAPKPATERGEPEVRHTVIEDDGARIDELRVRGQARHIVVTPKVGVAKSYEIIVDRSGRAPEDGAGGANGAAGKRVWNLLNF